MRVDENADRDKACGLAARDDMVFQVDTSSTDFSHFDRGMTAGFEAPSDFSESGCEHRFPRADRPAAVRNGFGLDASEPASEPIVAAVINHI